MGEPGGMPSLGLHRVGHAWSDLAAAAAAFECSTLLEAGGKHRGIEFIDSIELCLIFGYI